MNLFLNEQMSEQMNDITGKVNSVNKGREKYENLTCSEGIYSWLCRMYLLGRVGKQHGWGKYFLW